MLRPPRRDRSRTSSSHAESSGRDDEVCTLHKRIAECSVTDHVRVTDEPTAGIRRRVQVGHFLIEFQVHADDGGGRSGQDVRLVISRCALRQFCLSLVAQAPDDPSRHGICRSWPPLSQIPQALKLLDRNLPVLVTVCGSGTSKYQVQTLVRQRDIQTPRSRMFTLCDERTPWWLPLTTRRAETPSPSVQCRFAPRSAYTRNNFAQYDTFLAVMVF